VYELAPRLKTVPDVLYANVAGGDVREVEVICRPDDLLAHGLSAADVADQIGQASQLQPVGVVEGRPFAYQIIVNSLPARAARAKPPPRNIRAAVVYDQAAFVRTAVDNVRDAILAGGLFSVLILLAFLRSWRATLISALAIPVTLAITFLFLHGSGETLNLMSLGGLAVAIGLIIDDTVVVIENIGRHLAPVGTASSAESARRLGEHR